MGYYNGAEICEMVGLFLLNKTKNRNLFKHVKFGIYRDEGLAIIQIKSPGAIELIKNS